MADVHDRLVAEPAESAEEEEKNKELDIISFIRILLLLSDLCVSASEIRRESHFLIIG
jgi:hypothetical protein